MREKRLKQGELKHETQYVNALKTLSLPICKRFWCIFYTYFDDLFSSKSLADIGKFKISTRIKEMIHKKKRENASRLAFQNLEALSLFSCRLFFTSCRQRFRHWKLSSLLSKPYGVGLETKNCVYMKDSYRWNYVPERTVIKDVLSTEIFVDNKKANKLIDVHVLSQPSP